MRSRRPGWHADRTSTVFKVCCACSWTRRALEAIGVAFQRYDPSDDLVLNHDAIADVGDANRVDDQARRTQRFAFRDEDIGGGHRCTGALQEIADLAIERGEFGRGAGPGLAPAPRDTAISKTSHTLGTIDF
jgi:hypothetical protein